MKKTVLSLAALILVAGCTQCQKDSKGNCKKQEEKKHCSNSNCCGSAEQAEATNSGDIK